MIDYHVPVLVAEVLDDLIRKPDGAFCDGTTGTGGHALEILRRLDPAGRLYCIDQDPLSLRAARQRLGEQGGRVRYYRASFSDLDRVLESAGEDAFDGILLDLGLNSAALSRPEAGLSYQMDVPLHMALDPDLPETAAEFLARVEERELIRVLRDYGDVRRARLYARRLLAARARRPIATTGDLVRALGGGRSGGLSPGELSRCFQSLRVYVGQESERLETFLRRVPDWIRPGGRLVIISYASHEDRRVKRLLQQGSGPAAFFRTLHRKPLVPGRREIQSNRRARSAKLRAYERGGE